MICYIKEIQVLLSTLTKKVLFFKDFKALKKQWWISSTFKHFKDLCEPCSVILKTPYLINLKKVTEVILISNGNNYWFKKYIS